MCFRVEIEILVTCFIISLMATFSCSIIYYFAFASNNTYPFNFCVPELCTDGQRHVGCKPTGYASHCLKPMEIVFTNRLKRAVLKNHNTLRNQLASGNISGFKPAVRLATLRWNTDLAYLATINTKNCEMRYDDCHATKEHRYPGQNIAIVPVRDKRRVRVTTINQLIDDIIKLWFMEYSSTKQEMLDNFKEVTDVRIHNFSNIVHERTSELGCGMNSHFNRQKQLLFILVCNYSFKPHPGLPIYTSGPSCSKCLTGCNVEEYQYLCNRLENILSHNKVVNYSVN